MPETDDPKARITALIQRRDRLQANVQRVQGRLDSAKAEFASSEAECVKRNVPPDKIDEVIVTLTDRLTKETSALEASITAAETKVAPFLKEDAL